MALQAYFTQDEFYAGDPFLTKILKTCFKTCFKAEINITNVISWHVKRSTLLQMRAELKRLLYRCEPHNGGPQTTPKRHQESFRMAPKMSPNSSKWSPCGHLVRPWGPSGELSRRGGWSQMVQKIPKMCQNSTKNEPKSIPKWYHAPFRGAQCAPVAGRYLKKATFGSLRDPFGRPGVIHGVDWAPLGELWGASSPLNKESRGVLGVSQGHPGTDWRPAPCFFGIGMLRVDTESPS